MPLVWLGTLRPVTLRAVAVVASAPVVTPTQAAPEELKEVASSTPAGISITRTARVSGQLLYFAILLDSFPLDIAGDAAASDSGDAFGGNAKRKRATDDRTAGGNAYSGSSGNTGSGNIINEADEDATITNTGPGTSK